MHRIHLVAVVVILLTSSGCATSTRWCSDFDRRLSLGDEGLLWDTEPNGWGAIYDYLDAEDRNYAIERTFVGKPPGHPARKELYREWVRQCASGTLADDPKLNEAMAGIVPRLTELARRSPPKPDMSKRAELELFKTRYGYQVRSSRPLRDSEMVSYTRQLAAKYGRAAASGTIFVHGGWRVKTKLYPDGSVRVVRNGSNTMYR